jgi:hypothetical protein
MAQIDYHIDYALHARPIGAAARSGSRGN